MAARSEWCQIRHEVTAKLRGLRSDTCPFVNLLEKKRTQWVLTKDEMKNCVWLKPERVAQIKFVMDPGRSLATFKSSWDYGMIKTHAALRARNERCSAICESAPERKAVSERLGLQHDDR